MKDEATFELGKVIEDDVKTIEVVVLEESVLTGIEPKPGTIIGKVDAVLVEVLISIEESPPTISPVVVKDATDLLDDAEMDDELVVVVVTGIDPSPGVRASATLTCAVEVIL